MPLFDGYVAVDWSANARPTPVDAANSIWIAVYDANGMRELVNFRTRQAVMDHIETLLNEAKTEDRRLLIGFDFSFGYPEGTGHGLTGHVGLTCSAAWKVVWDQIAGAIVDHPNNWNNRFEAAAALNGHFPGEGPFWGLHQNLIIPGLLHTKPNPWGINLPPNLRHVETVLHNDPKVHANPQEVWQLWGIGSVGGQALTGIARLQRLRQSRDDVRVWPFETLGEEGTRHVLAEIYPSLIEPCPGNAVLDARQVAAVALTLRELDRSGDMQQYLDAPQLMPAQVIAEEGAILGMHAPMAFRAVAAQVTPLYNIN